LLISPRLGDRAFPLLWRVEETRENIGFDDQKPLLETLYAMVSQGCDIVFAADRFYGTAALIGWCQQALWGYRIRLKGPLSLQHAGAEIVTGDVARFSPQGIEHA
jgi:hypothetical protein